MSDFDLRKKKSYLPHFGGIINAYHNNLQKSTFQIKETSDFNYSSSFQQVMYSHSSCVQALQLVTYKVKLSTDKCIPVVEPCVGTSSLKFHPSLCYAHLKRRDDPLGWA